MYFRMLDSNVSKNFRMFQKTFECFKNFRMFQKTFEFSNLKSKQNRRGRFSHNQKKIHHGEKETQILY